MISSKLFAPRTAVYAVTSVLLVLQLVLAVQKYLSKPSMVSLASKPFARNTEGLAKYQKRGSGAVDLAPSSPDPPFLKLEGS